jgi:peptidoglycan/xylan/chitin deacetylase (PgdA/CDA1 family)
MAHYGIEIGSHTVSHPGLQTLDPKRRFAELSDSRDAIEQIIGQQVSTFSYPYRFPEEDACFVRSLAQMLSRAGYMAGVTTAIGRSSDRDHPLFQKRLPVNDADDARLFSAKLAGAYDWLHGVQLGSKYLRSALHHLPGRRSPVPGPARSTDHHAH